MLHDKSNNSALSALIGDVSWIYCKPHFNDTLRFVFRANNQLGGIAIEHRDVGTRYGQAGIQRSGVTDFIIHPMDRVEVIGLVAYINESLLNDGERVEWQQICDKAEYDRAEAERQREIDKRDRERQEYERLRAKFEK